MLRAKKLKWSMVPVAAALASVALFACAGE